jgi:membrane protein required for colicin V production
MEVANQDALASFWEAANSVDAIVIVVTIVSAALGFWSGFVWQLIRITSWLGAFWLAGQYGRVVAGQLGETFTPSVRLLLGWLGVFVTVLMVFYILGYIGRAMVDALSVELGDRILGALLGSAKGLLICGSLSLVVLAYIAPESILYRAVDQSVLGKRCAEITATLWLILPGTGKP